jgi:serine protease Do
MRQRTARLFQRWYMTPAIGALALAFFLLGLVTASEFRLTGASEAATTSAQATISPEKAGLPRSFAVLSHQLAPTVVNIKVTRVSKVTGPQMFQIPEGPFGDLFRRYFKEVPRAPREYRQEGAGSGVIISADGYILTNNHVVEGAEELTVTLADQQEYDAKVIGRDAKTDLAVVKIAPRKPLPVASLGDSEALQVGDWVLAIGNPFGLDHTVTAGIVSAKGRVIGAGPYDDFIQTDASINPGNSGGPLFNMQGEVVGINTAILPYGRGIGFAIPVNTAKPLIPQLIAKGSVTRGFLGVQIQAINDELAKALELSGKKGALVTDVFADGPAAKAGIERGDVIVAFNGQEVETMRELPGMVAGTPVGEKATVTVLRNGKQRQFHVTIAKLPAKQTAAAETPEHPTESTWGLELQDITPQIAQRLGLHLDHGVLVAGVEPGSPAAEAGLKRGDVLLEVNRQEVASVKEVSDLLASTSTGKNNTILLLVKRNQGSLYVALSK